MPQKKKINVKKITLERLEGANHEVGTRVFRSFEAANNWLRIQSTTAPDQGYDKHRYEVEWQDGRVMSGRLEVNSAGSNTNVGAHIRAFLRAVSAGDLDMVMDEADREEARQILQDYKFRR